MKMSLSDDFKSRSWKKCSLESFANNALCGACISIPVLFVPNFCTIFSEIFADRVLLKLSEIVPAFFAEMKSWFEELILLRKMTFNLKPTSQLYDRMNETLRRIKKFRITLFDINTFAQRLKQKEKRMKENLILRLKMKEQQKYFAEIWRNNDCVEKCCCELFRSHFNLSSFKVLVFIRFA